jgi:ferrous iron transport protein B
LIETGPPVILDINMIDEADRLGIRIDAAGLEAELGVPVAATSGVAGQGIGRLRERLADPPGREEMAKPPLLYRPELEAALREIAGLLRGRYPVSPQAVALLLLQEDPEALQWIRARGEPRLVDILGRLEAMRRPGATPPLAAAVPFSAGGQPAPAYAVALDRQARARELVARYVTFPAGRRRTLEETLNWITIHPLTGIPLLALVLYLGLYQFVGVLGAGTLVDFLETRLFEGWLGPLLTAAVDRVLPWPVLRDLFVGEYGVLTLGLRYALAIILPIVGTFFLAFSILEDSGYFPRLAMLVDRVFKGLGLNGRAVIPMVLGFGCDTMATMVTRTLETRRERIIATLLLALAIPCSAQLGVILAILSGSPAALLIWALAIAAVFLLVGLLAARLMPGERPSFYMELPPLRLPRPGNVLVKTYSRMQWYLLEVLPFFLLASVFIWAGRITGLFPLLIRLLAPVMDWLGLPEQAAVTFIFGFFRRDYGAAGLYDLHRSGLLSGSQLVVASVTLTLFLPCIAQLAVMIKERGWKTALAVAAFIFPFAFLAGRATGWLLAASGVRL